MIFKNEDIFLSVLKTFCAGYTRFSRNFFSCNLILFYIGSWPLFCFAPCNLSPLPTMSDDLQGAIEKSPIIKERNIQNTGKWSHSALARRRDYIYWLGFYVLILLPSLWTLKCTKNYFIIQSATFSYCYLMHIMAYNRITVFECQGCCIFLKEKYIFLTRIWFGQCKYLRLKYCVVYEVNF